MFFTRDAFGTLLLAAALSSAAPPVAAGQQAGAVGEAAADHPDHRAHQHREGVRGHTFEDTDQWVARFENPERDAYQKPDEVVAALGLEPGQAVADIGAGSGYFSFRLARQVAPGGVVYAVDIEPGMIRHLEQRRGREKDGDLVRPVLTKPDDPGLPQASLDLILIVNTYHHIADRPAYLDRLRTTLRSGGRIAVVDYREGDLPVGPPDGDKLPRAAVLQEFETAGYRLAQEPALLPYQYVLIFVPVLAEDPTP